MDKIDEWLFGFAYVMAMRDATLRQAFSAENKKRLWQKDADEDGGVTEAREGIKEKLRETVIN